MRGVGECARSAGNTFLARLLCEAAAAGVEVELATA